jgi:hypothetical protein
MEFDVSLTNSDEETFYSNQEKVFNTNSEKHLFNGDPFRN